jgi:hypothetical protein
MTVYCVRCFGSIVISVFGVFNVMQVGLDGTNQATIDRCKHQYTTRSKK